jgi:DNA-binding CsgD family transcriptional regulator
MSAKDLFVGRSSELAQLSLLLDQAKAGKGQFVAISGEPGIGKTSLVNRTAQVAGRKGFTVVWGRCHDGQYVPPYWPWKQIVRGLGTRSAKAFLEIVPEFRQATLAAERVAEQTPEQSRQRIIDAASALIKSVSSEKPACLIIDNLHCADGPSLELLEIVVREMMEWKALIAVAYREAASSDRGPPWETLSALAGEGLFHRISLGGWDQSEVQDYVRGYTGFAPGAELIRAIHQRTEGNPLFVTEVVKLLDNEKLLGSDAPSSGQQWEIHIPEKIRMAILGRFRNLSTACRDFLCVAAVTGRELDVGLLHDVTPESQLPLEGLLEEAVGRGIIEENAGQPGTYRFTHALIQEAVAAELSSPRRASLHLRIGEALERRYRASPDVHAGELADHFESAGYAAIDKALQYRQLAGQKALQMCGFEDAYEQYSRALALGEGRVSGQERAEISFGLAKSQHGLGDFENAVENLSRAFDLFVEAGDRERAFRVLEQPYLLTEKRGLGETRLLERALAIAGPDSPQADRLGSHYGLSLYHDTGDYAAASGVFQRTLERARQRGDRGQEKMTLANWAHAENDELHFLKSHELAEQAIRMAQEDKDSWVEATTRYNHFSALLGLGRLAEAEREVRAILNLGERLHSRYLYCAGMHGLSIVFVLNGDLAAAEECSRRVLAMGPSSFAVSGHVVQFACCYHRGDPAKGSVWLQKVIQAWAAAEDPFHWAGWLAWIVPFISWTTGYDLPFEAAEADARKVLASTTRLKRDAVNVSGGLGLMAIKRNDGQAAARFYAELIPFRGLMSFPQVGLTADHLLAALARTMGDPRLAKEHFEAAVAFYRGSGGHHALAVGCRDFAELLSADGPVKDLPRARNLWAESWAIAEQRGLTALLGRLKEMRTSLGQEAQSYPDSLSQREVDVLRLLAEGQSNEQIGDRLFISPHTVANHVQRILEKTGAGNRTEAAVYAVRKGLTNPGRQSQ